MRVLIVDDEASLRMTLAANLELEGFDVEIAQDGREALEMFRARPFDLVLSDIRMPQMNGVELFRELRALAPDLPVVLMTGFAVETLVEQVIREGAFAVLPKPFTIDHVVAALLRAARAPVVLLVDEDAAEAAEAAEALRARGVRARPESDLDAVREAMSQGEADVCVVAMTTSASDELVAWIRSTVPTAVIIAVAGRNGAERVRSAAAGGAFACMQKPLDPGELVGLIARGRALRPPPVLTRSS